MDQRSPPASCPLACGRHQPKRRGRPLHSLALPRTGGGFQPLRPALLLVSCPPACGRIHRAVMTVGRHEGLPSRVREKPRRHHGRDAGRGFALPRAGEALPCKLMAGMMNRVKRRSRKSKFRSSGFACIGDDDVKQPDHVARCGCPGPAPRPPKVTETTCPIRLVPVRLGPHRPHGPP